MSRSRLPHDTAAAAADGEQKPGMLGRVVRRLFVDQLSVKRVDGKLAVTLEGRPGAAAQPGAAEAPRGSMRGELAALLGGVPDGRKRLRVLAGVEHGLKHKDPQGLFLFEVEGQHLRAALRQLDALAPQPLSAGLAELRTRIVEAIASREQRDRELEVLMPRSNLMRGDRVDVQEASASDFARAAEDWQAKDPAA